MVQSFVVDIFVGIVDFELSFMAKVPNPIRGVIDNLRFSLWYHGFMIVFLCLGRHSAPVIDFSLSFVLSLSLSLSPEASGHRRSPPIQPPRPKSFLEILS